MGGQWAACEHAIGHGVFVCVLCGDVEDGEDDDEMKGPQKCASIRCKVPLIKKGGKQPTMQMSALCTCI